MTSHPRSKEFALVGFLLAVVILAFNYPDIFTSKAMYVDDYHRYTLGLENKIHNLIAERNLLRAYVIFPLYKLMTIDLVYARLAQTLLFYVPAALLLYGLFRIHTNVPALVAFFACLLPCILPGQKQIPSFIDGSYTVQGLLVFLAMLHLALRFIQKEKFSSAGFAGAIILFGASLEMMDHAVFLAPVAALSILVVGRRNRRDVRSLSLAIFVLIMALAKAVRIYLVPTVGAAVPAEPSWALFVERIGYLASHTLPYAVTFSGKPLDPYLLWSVFLAVVLGGFFLSGKENRFLLVFGLLWIFCSSIVFLTISRFYSPRLAHIPGFGVNFVLAVGIWVLCRKIFRKSALLAAGVVLLVLASHSGYSRIKVMMKYFGSGNAMHSLVLKTFAKHDFLPNSQIAVFNCNMLKTGGWWNYSSGYMKYATGRPDITGQTGPERSFYDPFDPQKRGFHPDHRMSGLSLEHPVFLFRTSYNPGYDLDQMEYALQWKDSSWTVYRFAIDTGAVLEKHTGNGQDEYKSFLKGAQIATSEIAFAGGKPPR